MRFKQLKRKSNVVLRKKLYKSGKNWLVATSLIFAGGIIFEMSPMVVKADNIESTSNTSQTENTQTIKTDNLDTAKVGNETPNSNTSSEPITPKSQSINSADNSATGFGEAMVNATSETPKVIQDSSDDENIAPSQGGQVPVANNTNSGLNDPTNKVSSLQLGKFASGIDESTGIKYSGSEWYLNQAGELHIEPGKWMSLEAPDNIDVVNSGAFWEREYDNYSGDTVNYQTFKIIFDGPVTAGKSVQGLFDLFENVNSIENLNNLDTSNTENFSEMFKKDSTLTQFQLPNISKATTLKGMYAMTGIKTASLSNFNIQTLTDYSEMFSLDRDLISVNLDGLNIPETSNLEFMFVGDSKLTNVSMKGIIVGSNVSMNHMFEKSNSLESLDLSAFKNTSKTIDALNFEIEGEENQEKQFTLTLNNSSIYKESNSSFDSNKYLGWIANDNDEPIDSNHLTSLYDGNSTNDSTRADSNGNTTWKLEARDKIDTTINYWTKDQDHSRENPAVTTHSKQYVGSTITVPGVPGYTNPENATVVVPDSGVIDVIVSELPSYKLGINVSYVNKPDVKLSVPAILPARTTDFKNSTVFQSSLKKLPNDNDTLNIKDTIINIGGLLGDPSWGKSSVKDFINDNNIKISANDATNLSKIINIILDTIKPTLDGTGNTDVSDFVDAVYDKYEVPVIKPDNNTENGHHSESSTESTTPNVKDDVITNIAQTSATFSDRPKVQLYDTKGKAISNLFLSPNSSWYNDEAMELSGKTYYRVATDKWVSADDVYIYTAHTSDVQVLQNDFGHLVNAHGQKITDRELSPMSTWFTDRYTEINGKKYYRVATNEFISSDEVHEY